MKRCLDCQTEKPPSDFKRHAASPDGYTYVCKDCLRARRAAVSHLTPDERYQRQLDLINQRYASNPEYRERVRNNRRKSVYGVTPDVYRSLLERQGGVCAICGQLPPPDEVGQRGFHLDHDHQTGQIRGLLCFMCNRGLGDFGDDSNRLRSALRYLAAERSPLLVRPPVPKIRAQCGTISGYMRHRRLEEEQCEACRMAWAAYNSRKNWQRRVAPGDLKRRLVAQCGTNSGYTAHYTRGEKPCDACRAARKAYNASKKAG